MHCPELVWRFQQRFSTLVTLVIVAAAALASGTGCTTAGRHATDEQPPKLTAEERALNLESVDYIWETVRDKYWDPDIEGLNWQAMREKWRPRVESAETMPAARAAMRGLLGELGKSHFAVFSGEALKSLDQAKPDEVPISDQGELGLEVRNIDGAALVVHVWPGPAQEAGLVPGIEILRIDEEFARDIFTGVAEADVEDQLVPTYQAIAIGRRLAGKIGDRVRLTVRAADGAERTHELAFAAPDGMPAQFGNLPPTWVRFSKQRLEGNVGYITFKPFMAPAELMPRFQQAVEEFSDASGIIIDLRGNTGGLGIIAMGMAGFFVSESDQRLGTMHMRGAKLNLVINPRLNVYEGPLAILIDELSASTSEFMAGGLQDLERARIFGTRSMGAALPSAIERLPNGDGFQYAFANYVSADGEVLEGTGVVPDAPVRPSRAALLVGRDAVIEAAVSWITEED